MKVESFDIWESAAHKTSIYDNIPIDFLDDFKEFAKNRKINIRYVYRGPRTIDRYSTRKADATAFSVYILSWKKKHRF